MKGVKLESPWRVGLAELEEPVPGKGEALIRVISAGICGSDIGAYRGANPLVSYPRVIGHEIAGEVLSVPGDPGTNPGGIREGDRVVVDPYLYCGRCYPCGLGRTNCCEKLRVLGVHVDGGMTEYFSHPADMLHKVPDNIPWDILPMVEPLVIALHGLHRGNVAPGEHVAIFGAGPIGLLQAMAVLVYGAEPIVIDPLAGRLEDARKAGVRHTVNPAAGDVTGAIMEITDGRGVEVVLESSGAHAAITGALDIAAHAGRIVFTGWPKGATELPTGMITKKELDIRGGRTSAGEFPEAIDLVSGNKVDVRQILTRVVSLEEAPRTIVDIEKHPDQYLKVNVMTA